MAIPGRKLDRLDPVAKVRCGIKENGRPKSVDHFVCDEPLFPTGKSAIEISFPYESVEENFPTGLEWWKGKLLACYTHDGGDDPVALRMAQPNGINLLDSDDVQRGPLVGQGRMPITCRADKCPHFGAPECRPMARLDFFTAGTPHLYRFETKGWKTIESISAALHDAARRGPLNAVGRIFQLSVQFDKTAKGRFPVVDLKETTVINTDADVSKADALVVIEKGIANERPARETLAAALDQMMPGWRERPAVIERIKEQGADVALAAMRERLTKELA